MFYFHCAATSVPIVALSSLSATSATTTWSAPPEFSLPVSHYSLTLEQALGSDQIYCQNISFEEQTLITDDLAASFSNLEEFSSYILTVVAFFKGDSHLMNSSTLHFTTLRTGIEQNH